jgi:hypothetical protein
MRAIHQFDLPEDNVEYMCHCKAADMALVLWKLQYEFWDKYENNPSTVEEMRNHFNELMDHHGIKIDELTE